MRRKFHNTGSVVLDNGQGKQSVARNFWGRDGVRGKSRNAMWVDHHKRGNLSRLHNEERRVIRQAIKGLPHTVEMEAKAVELGLSV